MDVDTKNLPVNLNICHQIILELLDRIASLGSEMTVLKNRLHTLLRNSYGTKSEKFDPNQLTLFAELLEDVKQAQPQEQEQSEPKADVKGHGRQKLPRNLPRKKVIHDLPDDEKACKCCGNELVKIGEDKSEQLEYIPASLLILEHIRIKYACKNCEESITTADKPSQPIEKGLPGPGLLSHVAVSKYGDHLPLNRLENIFNRHGVKLNRSTMCGWMQAVTELAGPLYKLMIEGVLKSYSIHTDDTPIKLRDAQLKEKSEGRFWVYRGDDEHPYTVYDYTSNRCREGPEKFLGDYAGKIHADAYAGYDNIYETNGAVESGCWAHARRRFFDSQDNDQLRAEIALGFIRRLYMIEREIKGLEIDAKTNIRRQKSKPVLAEFKKWIDEQLNDSASPVLPKSPIGKAFTYTLNQWDALNRYADDGRLDIDNNAAERALRPLTVGRKNYLFIGSNRGGHTAAVIYSLIESAKRHKLNPFKYLRDILQKLPDTKINDLEKFLPDKWQASQDQTAQD